MHCDEGGKKLPDNALTIRPIKLGQEAPFRIGDLEVLPTSRQIVLNGCAETLEPRIMEVLVALAQARGSILSRDDLIDRCWSGRIVGDNAIHRAVSKVRDVGLNFSGGAFHLETIAKVGYRMIVPEPKSAPEELLVASAAGLTKENGSHPASLSRRWLLAAGGSVVAASGLGLLWANRADPNDQRVRALIDQSEQAMRNGMPDSDAQGTGFLEEAVAIQPRNALAWGRLALARCVMAEHAPPEQTAAAVAGTQDAARQALALHQDQVDARSALALLPSYYGDWFAAEQRMNEVLAIDPEHWQTRNALAFMKVGTGRAREGSAARVVMAAAEPLHAVHQFRLIYAHWILGAIAEADRAAERALQLWPKHPGMWLARLYTLAFTGRPERALAHIADSEGQPDFPPWMIDTLQLSMKALSEGSPGTVNAAIEALLKEVARGPSLAINAIMILNGLGETDRAFDVAHAYLLETGPLIAGLRWRRDQVSINDQRRRKTHVLFLPVAASMRADPRFAKLVHGIGLTAYWDRSGTTPDYLQS